MDKRVIENPLLLRESLAGLRAVPKVLNPKWFYDSAGSALFEQITELPEYYPTRTELSVLRNQVTTLAPYFPKDAALIELGSGASTKTRVLLDTIETIDAYVPVDISKEFLHTTATQIDCSYPSLEVAPLVGDLLGELELPLAVTGRPVVGFFPGSTIGNLEPPEAQALLRRVRNWPNIKAFVLGIDLVKDPDLLVAAYDDAKGVTAAFNRNVLRRLNREAGAGFNVESFAHEARWNAEVSRIEMHLVSQIAQDVPIGMETVPFAKGESIHTENSHKYTRDAILGMAARSNWHVADFLTDDDGLFAVAVLVPNGE